MSQVQNALQKLSPYAVPLLAPVSIAIAAALIVWYVASAATTTPQSADEGTRIMLQRRCAMPVQMMTVRAEDPYTGKPVEFTRAVCAQPVRPEVIND